MTRKTGMVEHTNLVVGWEHPKQHEIFCKRDHKVRSVDPKGCEGCPYFVGVGRMDAITCKWEDTLAAGDYAFKTIHKMDVQDEFLRVSQLIDDGVLKKG